MYYVNGFVVYGSTLCIGPLCLFIPKFCDNLLLTCKMLESVCISIQIIWLNWNMAIYPNVLLVAVVLVL